MGCSVRRLLVSALCQVSGGESPVAEEELRRGAKELERIGKLAFCSTVAAMLSRPWSGARKALERALALLEQKGNIAAAAKARQALRELEVAGLIDEQSPHN
jgi:hypothetical protein